MIGKEGIDVSLVIPAYNEADSLPELVQWIDRVNKENNLEYEVIIVDDGSTDGSWSVIENIAEGNACVRGIKFNRNYGKSAALDTGFKASSGRVVITMDADLQDSPDEIPELVAMIRDEGYDMVSGWKKKRHDPITKTIPSKFFNKVTSVISKIDLHDFNCGLKAYDRDVVKSVEVYGEMHRYIPVIAKWKGFDKIGEKVVQHRARKYGTTKFGLERFINGFLDLLSITFVMKYKKRPMHFFGTLGSLSFMTGFIITCWIILEKLYKVWFLNVETRAVTDQPLFFLALIALVVGVQLFLAGFLGEMITQTDRYKNDYLISEKKGFEERENA
ncbi:glycosyltransferase family 2 protein [Marinigracilibium pacificum]|uniref:Glycosyltransferase family 2 protein n=1 Tax=Marinigracilibium pacificum TaxID=2729599 RepID=A0A848J440_9BACT|nr:glycosyltransferase family 2 protein [Marinigracilibium pacificum]NMM50275.1 glycosyltransferase family 2 protein [Marinigracilibium pacificum]